jgi:hypothetical protein
MKESMNVSRPKMRRSLTAVAVTLLVSGLVSGCAGARPGVAAEVGTKAITLNAVDDATQDLCEVFRPQIQEQGQMFAMSAIRNLAVEAMITGEIAKQIADAEGLKPGDDYFSQYAVQQQASLQLPEELRGTYLELSTAATYAASIKQQAGLAALQDEGIASPSSEDQLARGEQIFALWADEKGVDLDPRFGLTVVDGSVKAVDTGVSTPVSAAALAGAAEQMDPADVAKLPAAQRCG